MNPKYTAKYQNLLWMGIKKSKRDSVRGTTTTRYIEPERVCYVEVTIPDTEPVFLEGGAARREIKPPTWDYGPGAVKVTLAVNYLKTIVDNITSDRVTITADTDYPVTLKWNDQDGMWRVLVAPIIEHPEA